VLKKKILALTYFNGKNETLSLPSLLHNPDRVLSYRRPQSCQGFNKFFSFAAMDDDYPVCFEL
jgi:hypothetical protein